MTDHTELLDVVVERLAGSDLPGPVSSLVLASVLGDQELREALGGTEPRPQLDDESEVSPPDRMYLSSVAVEGFRGIAGKAQLGLQPGPGLTLVVGRNGSGKSSFAEAAELALTGTSMRWASGRAKVWQEGWRNLHHAGSRSIEVRLSADGRAGQQVVRRAWAVDDVLAAGTATLQRPGGPVESLTAAGLGPALATYRPFLSYNELGTLLEEGPSKLYDAISQVLGLELLVEGEARLTEARKGLEADVKMAKAESLRLDAMLEGHPDPRAEVCRQALAKRTAWDVDAIERAIAGDPAAAKSRSEQLERLARLPAPSPERLGAAATALRVAAAGLAAVSGTDAARAGELAELLGRALAVHRHAGDSCPVCGTAGVLDDDWRTRTESEVQRLRHEARASVDADRRAEVARRDALQLLGPAPAVVTDAAGLLITTAVREAWARWSEPPSADLDVLATHVEDTGAALVAEVEALSARAAAELHKQQQAWTPEAEQLAAWLPKARAAVAAGPNITNVKAAVTWLRSSAADLRNERFSPIAKHVRSIWETLRQTSSVSIDQVTLKGIGNRRAVELSVTVDDVAGAALAVMSQGELHAMALSLFLPRATLPQSPFGFIVIDDPVQSMDASRVDGLARVLNEVAATHQVVVFTHDERLPEAARRLRIPATVLEVTRGDRSAITVRRRTNPVDDYLEDARVVLATKDFPAEARRRVVPGLCRSSLEAACVDVIRRRRLTAGETHVAVERLVDDNARMLPRLALAMFDDADRAGDVLGEVNRRWGRPAADTVQAVKAGAHQLIDDNPEALVAETTRVAHAIVGLK